MPTTYRSILLAQPANGDVVFLRRFTRDPPVLATWDASAQQFTLAVTAVLTIVGGTFAGTHACTFVPGFAGTRDAWVNLTSGIYLLALEVTHGGQWQLRQTDLATAEYDSPSFGPPPFGSLQTSFSTVGSPSWTGPTSMILTTPTTAALLIPASLVQAWRPQ